MGYLSVTRRERELFLILWLLEWCWGVWGMSENKEKQRVEREISMKEAQLMLFFFFSLSTSVNVFAFSDSYNSTILVLVQVYLLDHKPTKKIKQFCTFPSFFFFLHDCVWTHALYLCVYIYIYLCFNFSLFFLLDDN